MLNQIQSTFNNLKPKTSDLGNVTTLSFLILFLELLLIRYLPAYVYYLGYFSNFILIASLLGIGVGFLLSKIKTNLIYFTPLALVLLIGIPRFFLPGIQTVNPELIFFRSNYDGNISLPSIFVIPAVFILVALTFIFLAQPLGRLFSKSKNPLKTYLFDIIGSIIGIVVFSFLAYFGTPPLVWLLLFVIVFIYVVENLNSPSLNLKVKYNVKISNTQKHFLNNLYFEVPYFLG